MPKRPTSDVPGEPTDPAHASLEAGTSRHSALVAARNFKACWMGLGKHLATVQSKRLYAEWGYADLASYCRRELHIREETARKLIRSFHYLTEYAPDALATEGDARAPALDVVDLLRRARTQTRIDGPAWASVQRDVLAAEDGPTTRKQVLERLRAADPEAFAVAPKGDMPLPPEPAARGGEGLPDACAEVDPRHARKVLLLAERLHALLAEQPALAEAEHHAALAQLTRSLRRHARIEAKADSGRAVALPRPLAQTDVQLLN